MGSKEALKMEPLARGLARKGSSPFSPENNNSGRANDSNPASVAKFNQNRQRLIGIYGGMPWIINGQLYSPGVKGLHEEIEDFCTWVSPTEAEQHNRANAFERLKTLVLKLWPNVEVDYFGSFRTGLYLPTSDIDVAIRCRHFDDVSPLKTLKKALAEQGIADADSIHLIVRAVVPILKFTDRISGIRFDVSFNAKNGVEAANLILEYVQQYPVLDKLVLVLKQFLLQRDLHVVYQGGIGSFALTLMIVSFLQSNMCSIDVIDNLGILLIQFLRLYGSLFNYDDVCIRVKNGGSYVPKVQVKTFDASKSTLSIEDPLNPKNDVGRSSYGARVVRDDFERANAILTKVVMQAATRNQRPFSGSYLVNIICITDKVIQYREMVSQMFAHPKVVMSLPAHLPAAENAFNEHQFEREAKSSISSSSGRSFISLTVPFSSEEEASEVVNSAKLIELSPCNSDATPSIANVVASSQISKTTLVAVDGANSDAGISYFHDHEVELCSTVANARDYSQTSTVQLPASELKPVVDSKQNESALLKSSSKLPSPGDLIVVVAQKVRSVVVNQTVSAVARADVSDDGSIEVQQVEASKGHMHMPNVLARDNTSLLPGDSPKDDAQISESTKMPSDYLEDRQNDIDAKSSDCAGGNASNFSAVVPVLTEDVPIPTAVAAKNLPQSEEPQTVAQDPLVHSSASNSQLPNSAAIASGNTNRSTSSRNAGRTEQQGRRGSNKRRQTADDRFYHASFRYFGNNHRGASNSPGFNGGRQHGGQEHGNEYGSYHFGEHRNRRSSDSAPSMAVSHDGNANASAFGDRQHDGASGGELNAAQLASNGRIQNANAWNRNRQFVNSSRCGNARGGRF